MRQFLERVLPGDATAMVELRSQLLAFAINPATNHLLIRGPSGAGKSTAARALAALVRVAMLTAEEAELILSNLKIDGANLIEIRSLSDWYVELALTGLVESIADVQLFGSTKGAYTGAVDAPGIFEAARTGRMGGKPTAAGTLTGGVVFLDEIGDLPAALQGKLLAVLSGGSVYRVGGEGNSDPIEFNGTVISASWKPLGPSELRQDLLARVAGTQVFVPGLGERAEDLTNIIHGLAEGVLSTIRSRILLAEIADPTRVDKAFWREWSDDLPGLSDEQVAMLAAVDWSNYGEMRGLTAAIKQVLVFREDVSTVVERLARIGAIDEQPPIPVVAAAAPDGIVARLLARTADGTGLAAHMRALAIEDARDLRTLLQSASLRARVAERLGIPEAILRTQMHELGRTRRRAGGGAK
jgi:DNA-binding NtrC family response regulator